MIFCTNDQSLYANNLQNLKRNGLFLRKLLHLFDDLDNRHHYVTATEKKNESNNCRLVTLS